MRAALYVPGSAPRMIEKARTLDADAMIFDLEDAVSASEKLGARVRVAEELERSAQMTRWVRINPTGTAEHLADLEAIVPKVPDGIVLPKADVASVTMLDRHLRDAGALQTPIVALVESAAGLLDIAALCRASSRLIGLQLGAEDLTAELGVQRTASGDEIRFARQQLALAAHAHRLMAIDTPFLAIGDEGGLRADVAVARSCGMTAKACIHPVQVPIIDEAFQPDPAEVEWAVRVIAAAERAEAAGKGAVAVDGHMIDAPVVARARRVVRSAQHKTNH